MKSFGKKGMRLKLMSMSVYNIFQHIDSCPFYVTRRQMLSDRVFTSAPPCYNTKTIPARSMDTDHDIVIAIPINQLYKATRGTDKTITTRSGKISYTIEEIGNIDWQLTPQRARKRVSTSCTTP
jgi:hypothetical protein